DPELAGRPVQRRERELLGDFLKPLRVAPGPGLARVLGLCGRVARPPRCQIDEDQHRRDRDRAEEEQLAAVAPVDHSKSSRVARCARKNEWTLARSALTVPPSSPSRSEARLQTRAAPRGRKRG